MNKHEEKFTKSCDLCGHIIQINEDGRGRCDHCNWLDGKYDFEHPDEATLGNFLSLNNAKRLYAQGKPLVANFDEFIEILHQYDEMQFTHKNNVYGVIREDKIMLFCVEVKNSTKIYNSYDDFYENADIDGLLLKNIWDEVEEVNYLQ